MTNAAITPGTQPQSHNKKTIRIEPQPLSITANGGQIMERMTLKIFILKIDLIDVLISRFYEHLVTILKTHSCQILQIYVDSPL